MKPFLHVNLNSTKNLILSGGFPLLDRKIAELNCRVAFSLRRGHKRRVDRKFRDDRLFGGIKMLTIKWSNFIVRSLGFNKTGVDSASRSTVDGGLLHFHLLLVLLWVRIRDTGRDDEGEEAAGGEDDEQVEEHQRVRVLRHHHRVQDSKSSIWKGVSKTWSVSGGWISSPRNCLITNGPYNHAVQWVPEQTNGLEMDCAGNINKTKAILAPER